MRNKKEIKCVIWDLDNTIWEGILAESDKLILNQKVISIIKILDERGILNSIASKNDFDVAIKRLKMFGIEEYFIYPEIDWQPKSIAVEKIAKNINIGIDSIAFVDDQEFELQEVKYKYKNVETILTRDCHRIPEMSMFNPTIITQESRERRSLYQNAVKRDVAEKEFVGTQIDFLKQLKMVMTIKQAKEEDLDRVKELTIRTHQLNTTGYTYSHEELKNFIRDPNYKLYVADLSDKFGSYGKIGIVLLECKEGEWVIKLLLMSCRVMSRGVGNAVVEFLVSGAIKNKVRLTAEFRQTDFNKLMFITYKMLGFKEKMEDKNIEVMEYDFSTLRPKQNYIKLVIEE